MISRRKRKNTDNYTVKSLRSVKNRRLPENRNTVLLLEFPEKFRLGCSRIGTVRGKSLLKPGDQRRHLVNRGQRHIGAIRENHGLAGELRICNSLKSLFQNLHAADRRQRGNRIQSPRLHKTDRMAQILGAASA